MGAKPLPMAMMSSSLTLTPLTTVLISRHNSKPSSLARVYSRVFTPRRCYRPSCIATWTPQHNPSPRPLSVPNFNSVKYSSFGRSFFSSIAKNDAENIRLRGEECYRLATDALKNASKAKQKREERLLQEQFKAMDKQKQKTQQRELRRQEETKDDPRLQKLREQMMDSSNSDGKKDRAAGVAVVRTIVKQSRADHAVQVEQWTDKIQNPITTDTSAKSKKQQLDDVEHWQQIAQKHMEESALRYGHRLGLVRLGNEALELAKEADSDSTALFDAERCRGWIDESPIDLATILELNDNIKVKEKGGDLVHEDDTFSPYHRLALHLYKEAGKQGSAEGWYNLGHLLWDDVSVANNDTTKKNNAMVAFHKSMELGDADAMYFVAAQYLSHEDGENESFLSDTYKQYGQSFITSLQTKASDLSQPKDKGLTLAFTNNLHQHGYKLLHHAVHQHSHGPALHHLALLHNEHGHVEEFQQLLSKAADTGNPDSLFLQGHCYYFGSDGYNQNSAAALENFLAAAENGHVDAMVSAGAILHQGHIGGDGKVVVQRDQQRAFELYQQAGELGSIEGWRNVVSCYATGQGVPKCLDTAMYIADTMLKEDKNV